MTDHAAFRATYSDFRLIKTRKVAQFVFEVPLEGCNSALNAMGGMPNPAAEVWCAVARLDPAQSHPPDQPAPELNPSTAPAPARVASLAQIAGILCADPLFQKYMGCKDEDSAAYAVRNYCYVKSRSEIKVGTEAGEAFEELCREFRNWRDADKYVERPT